MKGVYLLLDLITEHQAGPWSYIFSVPVSTALTAFLVDKIIIAQQSLQEFIDALSTDSNSSITNVDFKALDNLWLKPIGLYGSKEEIVRFLREINVVDEKMDAEVILRPGLSLYACLLLVQMDKYISILARRYNMEMMRRPFRTAQQSYVHAIPD
ncbi:hypothetical protein B0F90DRAFT_624669 [Multifurca ochricompacta]|uniref:Uncharacterized protein n=1 Tax=Multifurca ochricompacta TaxID=376703 RepID=A0AAD4LWK9_9AGAM|nr:hypothetical protein B0F90DRAFT_624669 [Multifurca ochricompacta]